MNVEIFEALMLICFGSAWPFAIVKSWRSRSAGGKSPIFLVIILIGYLSGICAHVLRGFSPIMLLYGLNASMVFTDLCLVLHFRCEKQQFSHVWQNVKKMLLLAERNVNRKRYSGM